MSLNAEKKILPKISMRKTKKRVAAAQPPPNSKPPLEADAPAQYNAAVSSTVLTSWLLPSAPALDCARMKRPKSGVRRGGLQQQQQQQYRTYDQAARSVTL